MAVIGNLKDLKNMFKKQNYLIELYEFLESCDSYSAQEYKNKLKIELSNGIFVMLQTYNLKTEFKDGFFESHIKYVDFQLSVEGQEVFIFGNKKDFEILEINADKDYISYKPNYKANNIYSKEKNLCVFFESDVHSGGYGLEIGLIKKVVAKVPKELLKLKF